MQNIKFCCQKCNQPLEAPEDMQGAVIDCPVCNIKLRIPILSPQSPQEKPSHGSFWSSRGRLNRELYFAYSMAIGFAWALAAYLIIFPLIRLVAGGSDSTFFAFIFFGGLPLTITVILICYQVAKRLHDINRPGSHTWLLLIPLYNFYIGALLLLKRGTQGPNQYGPDPLASSICTQRPPAITPCQQRGTISDDALYAQAYEEIENGTHNRGLWAKAFSAAQGRDEEAKALYIKLRVEQAQQS